MTFYEILSTSYSTYLAAQLALLPLILLYCVLRIDSSSLLFIHRIHKSIIVFTLSLPFLLMGYTKFQSLSFDGSVQGLTSIGVIDNTLESSPKALADSMSSFSSQNLDHYPMISDFMYYVADLVGFLSICGLLVFLFRWLLQEASRKQYFSSGRVSLISDNIQLIVSPLVRAPFVLGLARKQIFIPFDLDEETRPIVLAHELNHIRLNHHFWAFLEVLLRHLFWFNPVVFLLGRRGRILRELECDLASIDHVNKFSYSKALIKSAERVSRANKGLLSHSWMDKETLKYRIEYVLGRLNPKTSFFAKIGLALSLVLGMWIVWFVASVNDDLLKSEILTRVELETRQLSEDRSTVNFAAIPAHLIQCLMVHQDRGFFDHDGLSGRGIARALATNFGSWLNGGEFLQSGGSTITQQLAKSFLKNQEKNFDRKLKELKISRVLEDHYSKQQIIEMYLNRVYFGNGSWGLAEASRKYFDKEYQNLKLSESAMLIPFLDAPVKYNLIQNRELAKERQIRLLARLKGE
ncbi:MAG: transglycosylase domain-containing protein [Pseudobacteriovorax sp.]|nr:transglycosylase domain-containing protein [Pseudobacteriovorax sp.]